MSDYQLTTPAYLKLLLHAAKHPTNACHGLLIGEEIGASSSASTSEGEGEGGTKKGFVLTDAIPLFHHQNALAPEVETCCMIIDTWAKKQKQKIVGYYFAPENELAAETKHIVLDLIGQKMADHIEQHCSRACVLLVSVCMYVIMYILVR